VYVELSGTDMVIPVMADYEQFLRKRLKQAKPFCRKASFPKTCTRVVTRMFAERRDRPCQFGTVVEGEAMEGKIAFDIPDALNEGTVASRILAAHEVGEAVEGAVIHVGIQGPHGVVTYEFPIGITVYDDINQVPGIRKRFYH